MSTQEQAITPALTALGLSKRVQELDSQIKAFSKLATAGEYTQVAEYGLAAARIVKEATEFYAEETAQLYKLWKDKVAERSAIVDPASTIKDLAARLCGEWQQEKERERRAEELRQQEIERQRAEDAVVDEAAQLEREGFAEEAQAMIEAPVVAAPVIVASAVPKVNGVSKPRGTYKAEVTSLALLVKAAAEGKVPVQMLQPNQSALDSIARTLKEELRYPGVRVIFTAKSAFKG